MPLSLLLPLTIKPSKQNFRAERSEQRESSLPQQRRAFRDDRRQDALANVSLHMLRDIAHRSALPGNFKPRRSESSHRRSNSVRQRQHRGYQEHRGHHKHHGYHEHRGYHDHRNHHDRRGYHESRGHSLHRGNHARSGCTMHSCYMHFCDGNKMQICCNKNVTGCGIGECED